MNREFIPVHAAFHHALPAGCPNGRLLAIFRELRDNAELYRMWSPVVEQSGRDIAWEHRELTRLALERDVEACADLLARHLPRRRARPAGRGRVLPSEPVVEAAVVGVPDAVLGEAVCAVIVRRPGAALDEDTVVAYARTVLASYKKPRIVRFADELPRNSAGKVLKQRLRTEKGTV